MPLPGYKTITIKEASKKKLGELKVALDKSSEAKTAEDIIDEKHRLTISKKKGEVK